ncbi:MAG: helix-turn-helix domain-containing protein [Atribacterota bacterium]|nr:helix-turn-helix domain-containing protein [Atribacterota bacterium]
MKKEILNKQKQLSKDGYIVVPNYFLRKWVKMLGIGPAMLYLYLLTYCHKGKDVAWPTISTLSKTMDLTPKTITKYRQILVEYSLIKKISKRKTSPNSHRRNIYRLSLFDVGKNTLSIGNISSYLEVKFTPDIGKNLPTNNNNINSSNITTTNRENIVAAVDFIKIKEKGDLSACNAQAEEKMRVMKERLRDLDFEWKFIEQLVKDFSPKKIEEKLDLLMEKRNIQNPAGWLRAALKNDYQDMEEPPQITPRPHLDPPPSRGRKFNVMPSSDSSERGNLVSTTEQISHEKALEAIKLIQDNLSACIPPLLSGKSTRVRENVGVR